MNFANSSFFAKLQNYEIPNCFFLEFPYFVILPDFAKLPFFEEMSYFVILPDFAKLQNLANFPVIRKIQNTKKTATKAIELISVYG